MEIIYGVIGKMPPFNRGTSEWMTNDNVIDISKAKRELKYRNFISLDQSLKETIKWYKKEGLL